MATDLASDCAAILKLMQDTRPHRISRGAWASYQLGVAAWPDEPKNTTRQRAARALRALRRRGAVDCLSTNGLWRLTDPAHG